MSAEIADRVYAYDNSVKGAEALLCARTRDGELRKVYGPLPQWAVGEASTHGVASQLVG